MNIPLTPIRFLRYAEQQFPGKTAVVCKDLRFTYAQFAERACRLAGALRKTGVKPGERVAFLSMNCHRLLEAYYGVLEAGAVLLPLNIRLAPHELAYILNDAGAKVLFLEKQFLEMADSFRQTLSRVQSFILLDERPQTNWLSPQNYEQLLAAAAPYRADIMSFDENSTAELFYTSGTSANPKGVMLTHRNIYLHGLNVCLALHLSGDTVELHTIPLFHANGWGIAQALTFMGGTHVMLQRFDPAEVFRLIEQERVRACSLVPTMATALVNFPERGKYDLSSLERITIGGAASSPTLVREVEGEMRPQSKTPTPLPRPAVAQARVITQKIPAIKPLDTQPGATTKSTEPPAMQAARKLQDAVDEAPVDQTRLDLGRKIEGASKTFALHENGFLEINFARSVHVKRGTVSSYSGNLKFTAESGLLGTTAQTLVKAVGQGKIFVYEKGSKTFLLDLNDEFIYVEGSNLLALEDTLTYRVEPIYDSSYQRKIDTVKIFGKGSLAISTSIEPLTLRVTKDYPLSISSNSLVAWTGNLIATVMIEDQSVDNVMIESGAAGGLKVRFEGEGVVVSEQ